MRDLQSDCSKGVIESLFYPVGILVLLGQIFPFVNFFKKKLKRSSLKLMNYVGRTRLILFF